LDIEGLLSVRQRPTMALTEFTNEAILSTTIAARIDTAPRG
jgi:hypothetical protein